MSPEPRDPPGCLLTVMAFALIVAPVYLMLRYLLGLARAAYGFGAPATEDESVDALRICQSCHNTVLEPEFQHCPYCGAAMPALEPPGPR